MGRGDDHAHRRRLSFDAASLGSVRQQFPVRPGPFGRPALGFPAWSTLRRVNESVRVGSRRCTAARSFIVPQAHRRMPSRDRLHMSDGRHVGVPVEDSAGAP